MSREYEVLNRSAGAAVAVGLYSLYCALALWLTPGPLLGFPHLTWLFEHVPRWPLALGHTALAAALLLSVRQRQRLLVALCTSTLAFMFWAGLTVVPVWLGVVTVGSTMGLGAYAFASAYCGYWAMQLFSCGRTEGEYER